MSKSCILCLESNLKVIQTKVRGDEDCIVNKCTSCGLEFIDTPTMKKNFFERSYRDSYKPILNETYSPENMFELMRKKQGYRLEILKKFYNKAGILLDIGCSSGYFLDAVKPFYASVLGLELNTSDAAFAKKKGLTVFPDAIDDCNLDNKSIDVVTIFHTLQHIEHPISFLEKVKRKIKQGGHIVIEIPNLDDAIMSLYKIKEFNNFWYRKPHLFYYNAKTLSILLHKVGFIGQSFSKQTYNVLNHFNWILNKKPQVSIEDGQGKPKFSNLNNHVVNQLNNELINFNNTFIRILEQENHADTLFFVGQKTD